VFARFACLFFLVVALGAVASGCGGGDGSGGSSATGATTEQVPESPGNILQHAPTSKSPLDPLAEKLEAEGLGEFQPEPGGGNHVASDLSGVASGGRALFDVYYYDDPAYARKEGKQIEAFLAARPGDALVSYGGHYLISMSGQSKLTAADKREFKAIVKAAAAESGG
jgi:ABC-type glycerol-3-phosphate transport system substrate-binding protein